MVTACINSRNDLRRYYEKKVNIVAQYKLIILFCGEIESKCEVVDQDYSLKIRELEVPALFGSWILEFGARPPLACTSSSLESIPCP
ncbi:hypothetical protein STEG23_036041, partial [Scotinomys teguina]